MKPRRPALGRGLDALLPQAATPVTAAPGQAEVASTRTLPIELLIPDPEQPRQRFTEDALRELAESIKIYGVIQPIVVASKQDGKYRIVAGERRWRAAQLAGIFEVPVVVRDTPEETRFEVALVENLQRADLDPIEEARAFQQIMDLRGYTQEQLAARVSKDRSTVSNALRLLRLPSRIQDLVQTGQLSMGHARALLGLDEPRAMLQIAAKIIERKLSVRAVEALVRHYDQKDQEQRAADKLTPEQQRRKIIIADLEQRLARATGTKAVLKTGKDPTGPGVIHLPYQDLDELDRILGLLLAGDNGVEFRGGGT